MTLLVCKPVIYKLEKKNKANRQSLISLLPDVVNFRGVQNMLWLFLPHTKLLNVVDRVPFLIRIRMIIWILCSDNDTIWC